MCIIGRQLLAHSSGYAINNFIATRIIAYLKLLNLSGLVWGLFFSLQWMSLRCV